MELWDDATVQQVHEWEREKIPLVLIGASGYGKTRAAEQILKEYNIIRYYPCDFRESKDFIETMQSILSQRSILSMMGAGAGRAILIENIGHTTASDKPVLQYLASIENPRCPIVLTMEKSEKRHRDLLRKCKSVRISLKNKNDEHSQLGANREEISELAFKILRNEVTSVPPSASFTERIVLMMTLLENLDTQIEEWFHIFADKTAKRIYDEERWDLICILDNYIFPKIFETVKKTPFKKKPYFSKVLSYSSTRTLNRKSVRSLTGTTYDDPVVALYKLQKSDSLPKRFRVTLHHY